MTTTLNLIGFGVKDNKTNTPVTFDLKITQGSSVQELIIDIPHFDSSFAYDPDFSVTLGDNGGDGGGGGDGGSGGDLLPLIALSALVIPLIAILVVVVAVVVYYVAKYRRKRIDDDLSTGSVSL